VIQAFDGHARPLYERIVECERESRTLAALRDTLLPTLMVAHERAFTESVVEKAALAWLESIGDKQEAALLSEEWAAA